MREYTTELKSGITRSKEFEKKRLASYGVNVGTRCGNGCLYCSTGAVMRMHHSFEDVGESPFGAGYSIVDSNTPGRVARDARRMRHRGTVQLCTTVDAWAPESRRYSLGRRCLASILSQPGWTVRILTKNAEVVEDFDLVRQHADRVLVGLSITATPEKGAVMSVIEPNASPNHDRLQVLKKAHEMGLRTYAMFCPLLPGIAHHPDQIEKLIRFAVEFGAEEVFVEAVNARGPGLRMTQEALEAAGHVAEAEAIGGIRKRENWSRYVVDLIRAVQQAMRDVFEVDRLRFLLYPSQLSPEHVNQIEQDDAGVVWLRRRGNGTT
ncbi:MAG: radical SAM protein [bacterium]|nr:radical SAM protein [bacterium]